MRIIIKDSDMRPITIHFPTSLLMSRFGFRFLPIPQNITRNQMKMLVKELKHCKRRFRGLKLVEIYSADGAYVEIRL